MKNSKLVAASAIVVMTAIVLTLCSCTGKKDKVNTTPVNDFRLERFLGKWYEIARFDHRFERGMNFVSAEYNLRPDGKLRVTNTGIKDGELRIVEGKAKRVDPERYEGYLKVSFFLFFYADYKIIYLDEDYNYALISGSNDKYLWMMSRIPEISDRRKQELLQAAAIRGFDTSKLIWVNQ